jgi:hypothetical protein
MLVRNIKSVSNVQLFSAGNEPLMASRDFWKPLGRYLNISTEKIEEDKKNQVRIKSSLFGILGEAKTRQPNWSVGKVLLYNVGAICSLSCETDIRVRECSTKYDASDLMTYGL